MIAKLVNISHHKQDKFVVNGQQQMHFGILPKLEKVNEFLTDFSKFFISVFVILSEF